MTRTILLAIIIAAVTTVTAVAKAAPEYGFVPHSAFFSIEAKAANLIDPQAFVADPSAQAGKGPQGIEHVAGFRPAFGVDNPSMPVFNAHGKALGITLAQWFGAHGTVKLSPSGPNTRASLSFAGLVRRGRYSLFENHFAPISVTFTPLDGTGETTSFTAGSNGTARLSVMVPGVVTHAQAVLLVYHSDGIDHGMQRGALGIVAHHQLIMRVP